MDTGRLPGMDGQTPKGREPASIQGGSEGSAGGSIPPGDSKVNDGKTPAVFQLQQRAVLTFNGRHLQVTIVARHEFNNSYTVSNGVTDTICTASDLMTESDWKDWNYRKSKEEIAAKYESVLRAWPTIPPNVIGKSRSTKTQNAKRIKWLAQQLQMTPIAVSGAVRSLAHWNLITLKKDPECHAPE